MTLIFQNRGLSRFAASFFRSPYKISIISFGSVIFLGTILLLLPFSSSGRVVSVEDAFFTAVSSTCVTGLVVLDTRTDFSLFGQGVILALIQAGGLGIMTLSTFFMMMSGRRLGLVGFTLLKDSMLGGAERRLVDVLKDVFFFTCMIEGLGTLFLFWRFSASMPAEQAFYFGLFHAVSAFCNAGFSLFSNSLVGFSGDIFVNIIFAFLIITGGLGFLVLSDLKGIFLDLSKRRSKRRMSLHSKLVITVSILLIFTGTGVIALMEWKNTLINMPLVDKITAAFFHSVSARTAGFNSIFIGNMANETLFFIILLMFIGASPGSCGGGIKTTTFAGILLLGISRLRGYKGPQVFCRTISQESISRAVGIVLLGAAVVTIGTMVMLMTEIGNVSHYASRGRFLEILFEVVSAFGTVGLSTGITPRLTLAGKIIISAIMFIGRIGPLTVAMSLSRDKTVGFRYPEEDIMTG